MATDDPYKILMVAWDADKSAIKKAYRSLAQYYHPDKEFGDEEKFHRIQWAYELLLDDKRRATWDASGEDPGEARDFPYEMVIKVMLHVMQQGKAGDIVQQARDLIQAEHKQRQRKQTQAMNKLDRVKRMYGRVVGGKAFDDAVEYAETEAQNELTQANELVAVASGALQLLQDYEDTAPDKKPDDETSALFNMVYGRDTFGGGV